MPRILVLNPIGHDMYDQPTLRVACSAVGATTSVAVQHLPAAPATPFIASQEMVIGPLLSAVIQGERDGFDAVVIACCSDPGLRDAKTLVRIPVTAPFEAAARTGASFGRIAILYPGVTSGPGENLPHNGNWARQLARDYNITDLVAGTFPVPVEHPSAEECARSAREEPAALGTLMLTRMRSSLEEHGPILARRAAYEAEADVIFVACTMWAGMTRCVARAVRIPVLDPVVIAVRYAEVLITARCFSVTEAMPELCGTKSHLN